MGSPCGVGVDVRAVRFATVGEVATIPYDSGDTPDDPIDADALEDVADEIASLAAHLHAGMRRYLCLVARFDRNEGWKPGGHASCAHWLSVVTGHDLGTAREHVRVARALETLPDIGAAMGRGALSFAQVRALSRVATPDNELDLLELAEGCTAAILERVVRAWKRHDRLDEAERERQNHASRGFSVYPDGDGMYEVRGRLDPEVAAVLMRAVEAATDALHRKRSAPSLPSSDRDRHREAARRRADAIGLVAERALSSVPGSGSRAERYQVVLYVEPETLAAEGEPGTSEFADGTRVSAGTSRRLACDSGLIRVEREASGSVLDVGRKTRTIPPALRRALEGRDRGCRFPGCGSRFTEAHHVVHWADGGETSLRNTLLLCRRHHRLVHEEGWRIEWWGPERTAAFLDPRGQAHVAGRRSSPAVPKNPIDALIRSHRLRAIVPDARTAGARWRYERDIPDQVLFRAADALSSRHPAVSERVS